MSKIVRSMAAILYPLIAVFGGYLVLHGHLTPGGGFQGGAVAASAIALAVVAYGSGLYKKGIFSGFESFGLLLFIALGFVGMSYYFFTNIFANTGTIPLFGQVVSYGTTSPPFFSGGTVPMMNIAVGFEVVGGLSLIILALAQASFGDETGTEPEVEKEVS